VSSLAKINHLQILETFESECVRLESKPNPKDEAQYFNWLSWFAWENMMSETLSYLKNM
jgi:hypothetical protein